MHELEVLQGQAVGGRGDGDGGGGAVRGGGGVTLELASPLPHEASGAGGGVLKIQLLDFTVYRAFTRFIIPLISRLCLFFPAHSEDSL